jgi:hypothetical protein
MVEHKFIQSSGFRNFGPEGAREGFEVRIRCPNYRGMRLSLFDGVDITVDGETFSYEKNSLRLRDDIFNLEEMREAAEVRWELSEWASVVVRKPGGLTPGIHQVAVCARVRSPYFPPQFQPSFVRDQRLATIVLP